MRPSPVASAKRAAAFLFLAGPLVGASACASGGVGNAGGGSMDEITQAQIEANPDYSNAMDLVRRLRPTWLRRTTSMSFNSGPAEPVIFVDGIRRGPLASLRDISPTTITRMEYVNALDATTLYGTGYAGGVIQVFTR
jgi:hypothetical protein